MGIDSAFGSIAVRDALRGWLGNIFILIFLPANRPAAATIASSIFPVGRELTFDQFVTPAEYVFTIHSSGCDGVVSGICTTLVKA